MWRGSVLVVLSWILPVMVSGCGDKGFPVLTEHEGYSAYTEFCKRCHGHHGDGGKANRMAKRPIDLGSPAFADTADEAAVLRIVTEGKGRMKGYREKLTAREREAVSRYVLKMADAIADSARSRSIGKSP